MGSVPRTTHNLAVLRVDAERGLLLINGAIPGSRGGDVVVHPSVKIARISVKPAIKIDAKAGANSGTKAGKKAGT